MAATGTSSLGDGLVLVAFPLLAVSLTSNPVSIAGVAIAGKLPWLVTSLPAGALADRMDRRRLVAIVQAVRAAVLLGLTLVVASGNPSLVLLYLAAFAVGALETAFDAATRATIPVLVSAADLPRANGYFYAAETAGEQFAGPALGGLMFTWAAALPFLGDALSFGASSAMLSALPRRAEPPGTTTTGLWTEVRLGLGWFAGHRLMRLLAVVVATFAFCQSAVLSVLVLYGLHVLHLTRAGYGLFLAAGAVGDVGGSLLAHRVHARLGPARAIVAAGAAAAGGYLLLGATANTAVALTGYAIEAIVVALGNVATISLRHRLIPTELFGRVNNIFRMCVVGVVPLGALAGGLLTAGFGLHTTFLVAGVTQLVLIGLAAPRLATEINP